MQEFDIMIIGAGAAGLTAGLYTARAGMKVLLLEKAAPGGQMLLSEAVENFPGFPEGIKGQELAERFKNQAQNAGLKIITQELKQILFDKSSNCYTLETEDKAYSACAIILACGAVPKRLGLPGEEMLTGRGVSYCATCDGPLFRDQEIIVVGGGNAACEEASYLSKFVRKVTFVHRRDRLRADKVLQDRLKSDPKINFAWNSRVLEILGERIVKGVAIEDVKTAKISEIPCKGVFIFAGLKPNTDFLQAFVEIDEQGFILTDKGLQTSRKGIFACGDCRGRPLRQIVTACSEGAEAAQAARNYVEELKGMSYA